MKNKGLSLICSYNIVLIRLGVPATLLAADTCLCIAQIPHLEVPHSVAMRLTRIARDSPVDQPKKLHKNDVRITLGYHERKSETTAHDRGYSVVGKRFDTMRRTRSFFEHELWNLWKQTGDPCIMHALHWHCRTITRDRAHPTGNDPHVQHEHNRKRIKV